MRRVLSSYEDYYLRARPIRRLTRMATLAPGPAAGYRDFEISSKEIAARYLNRSHTVNSSRWSSNVPAVRPIGELRCSLEDC